MKRAAFLDAVVGMTILIGIFVAMILWWTYLLPIVLEALGRC